MKKKVLCTALVAMMLMTTTASAEPWWLGKYRVTFDNELGIVGNVTLKFASDGGSFIRPITKRYGEIISLENYVPTKYGYTFKGWRDEGGNEVTMPVNVTGAATYTATYTSTVNSYTITWVVDGNSSTEIYEYGQTPCNEKYY